MTMTTNNISVSTIKSYLLRLQQKIADQLSAIDGQSQFTQDNWQGRGNSHGRTWVIVDGKVFEKGAINFSHVHGSQLPPAATAKHPELAGQAFQALGISLIMHPQNPFVPTTHMNVRFFTTDNQSDDQQNWWFGGGYDLTPYYGFEQDCKHWHQIAKSACDPFGLDVYQQYKQWCDDYFFIKHRQHARGIGGLFFDDLNHWPIDKCFDFLQSVGDSFLPAYVPIVKKRMGLDFNRQQKQFQRHQQSRYVEFNLIYDRGTIFGLQYDGRVESILCSMPPQAMWSYQYPLTPGSAEADLYEKFLPARDWLN